MIEVKTLEIGGLGAMLHSLRLPFKREVRSSVITNVTNFKNSDYIKYSTEVGIDPRDIKLIQTLIRKGDQHAKAVRGLNVSLEINASRGLWHELVTYVVGTTPLPSESTMHTIERGVELDDLDHDVEDEDILQPLIERVNKLGEEYVKGGKSDHSLLHRIKTLLPEGYMQKRVLQFSYQTLRRIAFQRHNHRMYEWQIFIDHLHTLPFAEELIFDGLDKLDNGD